MDKIRGMPRFLRLPRVAISVYLLFTFSFYAVLPFPSHYVYAENPAPSTTAADIDKMMAKLRDPNLKRLRAEAADSREHALTVQFLFLESVQVRNYP